MPLTTTVTVEKMNISQKHWLDKWHVSPSVNRDYDFIDGLRGIAILMVIVGHHFYINPKSGTLTHIIGSIIGTGGYGVTLFYTLSGFLISWPFWKRKTTGSKEVTPSGYFQRRFWKIYPPLALSVLILIPFYAIMMDDWSYLSIGSKWLTGWAFLFPVSGKFNPVMWTLAIEVQFYLTLPLLFLCFKRVPPRISLFVITLLFLAVPVVVRGVTKKAATFHPDINTYYPSALDAFCLGILIAGLENMGFVKKTWVRGGVVGVVLWPLTLLVAAWLSLYPGEKTFIGNEILQGSLKFSAGCLLLFVAQPQHSIAKLLCAPWLRWCGIISYEWYLFHQPFALWARMHFGPAMGDPYKYALIVGIPLLSTCILSAMVYRCFSLPILRYGRGKNKN
jgi:peptidoglycan/LPS O-acetylase OafA/YrhL